MLSLSLSLSSMVVLRRPIGHQSKNPTIPRSTTIVFARNSCQRSRLDRDAFVGFVLLLLLFFFLGFSFWVVGLIDFGLLVVVDLILVVLWLLACDSFGLWACLWWWWFLVVVVGGHERERERERERG